MGFNIKKIGKIRQYSQWRDIFNARFLMKTGLVIACIVLILLVTKYTVAYLKKGAEKVGISTTKLVSQQLGDPMKLDELGNLNAMIVGYSGIDDRGGLLTDTIMVASFNPDLGAVTFISIPRDLFVDYDSGYKARLNGIYRAKYLATEGDEDASAKKLMEKVSEITGLEIPYYMLVDFEGFVEFIDELEGIEIDVREPIYDPYYPGPNNSYQTFRVEGGEQIMSGDVALKYARSRQTTSDFSRTLRQQQIIKAVIKKLTKKVSLLQLGDLQDLHGSFNNMVKTNVTMKQIFGVLPAVEALEFFFSFVYTADCDLRYLEFTTPGCVLRHADREAFGGAAVVIPEGASYYNLSYYRKTQDFAFWVTHHQEFLLEKAKIGVFNGMDKVAAREAGYDINGVASQLALDMKIRGFDVVDIDNTEEFYEKTTLYLPGYGWYPATVEMIRSFVDITEIKIDETGSIGSGDVSLILGQDHLKRM